MRPIALLVASTLATACATSSGAFTDSPTDALRSEVAQTAAAAKTLLRAQNERVWKHWVNGDALDLQPTYTGKDHVFSAHSIARVDALWARSSDGREKRALSHLRNYLAGEYVSARTFAAAADAATAAATMMFSFENDSLPLRDLERTLANEKQPSRRAAIYASATPAVQQLTGLRATEEAQLEKTVRELGHASTESFAHAIRSGDVAALAKLASDLLDTTTADYQRVMDDLAKRELGIPLAQLTRADLPRLFRPMGVDADFPKHALLSRARATFSGLGFALEGPLAPKLHLEDNKTQQPRPLALAVDIPHDVRVSMKLSGGLSDQASLLHHLALAFRDCHNKEARFELSVLGSPVVGRAFGLVFQDLVEDPTWLKQQAGLSGPRLSRYLAAAAAYHLFVVRRAAGQLLYAVGVGKASAPERQALYKKVTARALGFPTGADDEARAPLERDLTYASADALAAWLLAGQLQGVLRARFGDAWWTQPRAGEFLKTLWAQGNAQSAEEIPATWGDKGLRVEPMLERLQRAWKAARPVPD
ncbi:MAG: chromosome segregation protein SMC [Myxococcaceae bacterium]